MPVEISDWNDLDNVRNDLTGDYVLVNDLDSETDGYAGIGDDFEPIGFVSGTRNGDPFSGVLDGAEFQISDLVIEENDSERGGVAFITQVGNGGLVENLSVDGTVNSTIEDFFYGGLAASVGRDGTGTIENCVSHVDVTAPDGGQAAGLVGRNQENDDTIQTSYATGSVEGDSGVGGLVGANDDTIQTSYATGSVEGEDQVGGLVGENSGPVEDSYATGSVEGVRDVGGLAGDNEDTVTESYATGSVLGENFVGGLVGDNDGTVTDSYATGSVESIDRVGGLVGASSETIKRSYATGSVEGDSGVGGLVGSSTTTTVEDSYWDTEATGQSTSGGDATGLTTAEMQGAEAETNMDGFDFANVWDSVLESDDDTSADGYPILLSVDREDQLDAQGILILFDLTVETNPATDVSAFGATLNGELVELDEEADDADVFFEFGENVGDSQTKIQTLTTLDTFDDAVEIMTSDQTIEFRAVAEAEDADGETFVDEGDTLTFTTDTATIEGVINPDEPIEGAVVKAENKTTGESYGRDETDADGQYAFENISGLEIGQMLELLVDAKLPDEDENLSTVLAPTVGE